MDIVLTIAKTVVLCIASEICYIFSYDKNLKKLEEEVQRLERTYADFQHRVKEVERNGEKIFDTVQNWLKEVKDTVAEAKKLIDTDGGCCLGKCSNPSKKFEKMTQEISRVIANGKFDRISYHVPPEVTITPSGRSYEALVSRTTILNEIKEALKDPKINMIGVHGMGGVGKSTLVKELDWQIKKDGSFDVVVIAKITRSPDLKRIQDQIADVLLDRKLKKESEEGRSRELRRRIKQEKSILIFLDDIWSELDLNEVGIPFGAEHNGCKLVMTSRDLNVLQMMGTQREFDLKALQEEDSWNLFKKMAGDIVEEFNIKPIAQKVSKCCAGLPVLMVTMAKGLRRKDVMAWKDALTQLERFEHEELKNKVYPAVELSYNCLKNDELKLLFSFIGSLGLDHIHTGELFSYCWGLGFYRHIDTLTKARNRHYKLIDDLRATSLLLEADAEPERVKIHDVVGEVAKSIASRSYITYAVQRFTKMKEWPKLDQLQKCHYIIIPWSYIDELPEKLECPELKLLSLENIGDVYLNVPDNFFSGMRQLRTLHLHRMPLTSSLVHSFHLLTNLRALNLYSCYLEDIRIVSKLTNLEILTLEGSSINELPEEIRELTQLRLLNLTNCCELRVIPTNLLSSLTCLEELYMGGCYRIQWEVEGSISESSNASLGELRHLLQLATLDLSIKDTSVLPRDLQFLAKLERCNILIGDMWEWSLQWSGGAHETSRTLKLTDCWWTSVSLTTFEDLSFAKLKSVKDLLYDLNDEGFPQLKHLHIQDSDKLLHIINSRGLVNPHSAFPNLQTLVLLRLNRMEEICHGPLPTQSFAKLKVIKVKDCDRLKKLLSYSVIRNLSQLHEIKIYNCKDMTKIVAKEEQEDEKELLKVVLPKLHSLKLRELPMLQSFYLPLTMNKDNPSIQSVPQALFNQQVVMSKLETLELYDINTCKIWDDKLPVLLCLQNLIVLKVNGCNSLTSLFPSSGGRELVKLQRLDICNCSMLKEIFVQEEEVQFPNLEALNIDHMSNLKSIWPNEVASNSFCKLRKISIYCCEGLDYVFPISVVKELRQLQHLQITSCDIKNIVEKSDGCDKTLVYLEKLIVSNCYNMKTIVPSSLLFHNLEELKVTNCHEVVNIITPSAITCLPKLHILRIENCGNLEEIYGNMNESDAPLALGEIAFIKLEQLYLQKLPRLRNFCEGSYDFKFRSLHVLCLIDCPVMKTFCNGNITTPSLTKVHYEEEDYWDGDLNTTITTAFEDCQLVLNSSSESEEEEQEKEGEGEGLEEEEEE